MPTPQALADAVAARVAGPTFTTYRGDVPTTPTKGYVVLYFDPGESRATRMPGAQASLSWTFRAVCVGFTDDHCLAVTQQARGLLTGWRPIPEDRGTGPLIEDDAGPILRDDSVPDDIRYSATLHYRLPTHRS